METQRTSANQPTMTTKLSTVAQTAIEQRGDVMCYPWVNQSIDGYKEGWICGVTSDKEGGSYCFFSLEII